jgi:hypothetical protein
MELVMQVSEFLPKTDYRFNKSAVILENIYSHRLSHSSACAQIVLARCELIKLVGVTILESTVHFWTAIAKLALALSPLPSTRRGTLLVEAREHMVYAAKLAAGVIYSLTLGFARPECTVDWYQSHSLVRISALTYVNRGMQRMIAALKSSPTRCLMTASAAILTAMAFKERVQPIPASNLPLSVGIVTFLTIACAALCPTRKRQPPARPPGELTVHERLNVANTPAVQSVRIPIDVLTQDPFEVIKYIEDHRQLKLLPPLTLIGNDGTPIHCNESITDFVHRFMQGVTSVNQPPFVRTDAGLMPTLPTADNQAALKCQVMGSLLAYCKQRRIRFGPVFSPRFYQLLLEPTLAELGPSQVEIPEALKARLNMDYRTQLAIFTIAKTMAHSAPEQWEVWRARGADRFQLDLEASGGV